MSSLHVIDLGLDYKSFAGFLDAQGRPLIGNQFHFAVEDIAARFLPTCGLLTAVLHGYAATASTAKGQVWLDQYRKLQAKLYDETKSVEAGNALSFVAQYPSPIVGPLFEMLDRQMNMSGSNAPSQRRINVDSKHALCNLHLNERACHQGSHCNQLHLATDATVHRHDFYAQIVEVLQQHRYSTDAIRNRLVDAMFFAKYGNRVTVEVNGQHFQFFKTAYSEARLAAAVGIAVPAGRIVIPPGTTPHKQQKLAGDAATVLKPLIEAANDLLEEKASPTTRKWNAVVSSFVARSETPEPSQVPIAPELAKQLAAVTKMDTSFPSTEDGITPLIDAVHESRFNMV